MKRALLLSLFSALGFAACDGCRPAVGACSGPSCLEPDSGVARCDPAREDNSTRDTDCDGLSDADEYHLDYGGGAHTDPCNPDSDGDGLGDGLEMGRTVRVDPSCTASTDADPLSKTSPVLADSDADGLNDGIEDANRDGKVDPGESNPERKDSDCDGLTDADEVKGTRGCPTDPLNKDSDDDSVPDGVENGLTASIADPACLYGIESFDAEPGTHTDACKADSDGDGIIDGAEDTNHNGKTDPGELNPLDAADSAGPAGQACSSANLKPIAFHAAEHEGLQLALIPPFAQTSALLDVASGQTGLMFYDAAHHTVGLAFSKTPVGATASAEETDARARLGGVSGAIVQTFTSWDGFTQSVRASYDQDGTADLKTEANKIARTFLGVNVEGAVPGLAGVTGPFKIQAEYVRRSDARVVIVFAITPAAAYVGEQVFRVDDVAGGSALSQNADSSGTQCEVFTTSDPVAVDFLWVVDNSCSMAGYQAAVGNAGSVMGHKLTSAGLDWRVGGLTTAYYVNNTASEYRPFTRQLSLMEQWFTQNSSTWFGIGGTGAEESLSSAQQYLQSWLLPKSTDPALNKLRVGADLHLILLGDADDQSPFSIASLNAVFANYDGANSQAIVHGIVCPQGQLCGETQGTPRRNLDAITTSGGVLGDINVAQSGSAQLANTLEAIMSAAIARTGHRLLRPPVAATIKVAIEPNATLGACNVADVPRDRSNGFDFDSATRRLVLFGSCRPSAPGKKVAVSYRFWNDASRR
jgi:hypothetical protein